METRKGTLTRWGSVRLASKRTLQNVTTCQMSNWQSVFLWAICIFYFLEKSASFRSFSVLCSLTLVVFHSSFLCLPFLGCFDVYFCHRFFFFWESLGKVFNSFPMTYNRGALNARLGWTPLATVRCHYAKFFPLPRLTFKKKTYSSFTAFVSQTAWRGWDVGLFSFFFFFILRTRASAPPV